jgi:hypothetical protein
LLSPCRANFGPGDSSSEPPPPKIRAVSLGIARPVCLFLVCRSWKCNGKLVGFRLAANPKPYSIVRSCAEFLLFCRCPHGTLGLVFGLHTPQSENDHARRSRDRNSAPCPCHLAA